MKTNKVKRDPILLKRQPKRNCECCGLAQRFGTVIYCRCMLPAESRKKN